MSDEQDTIYIRFLLESIRLVERM